jgi:rod shape-determining protein MreD
MPRRPWAFRGFILLLVFLHFALHIAFGLSGPVPDLLTVAALLGARRLRGPGAAALGFVFGLLEDALALIGFGSRAIALAIAAYLGAWSRDLFEGESTLFLVVYFFLGKWVRDAVVFVLNLSAARGDVVTNLLIDAPIAALITSAGGTIAFLLYRAATGDR